MKTYENGAATRRIIYQSAKRLFFRKGYDKTTFDDIASEAHVNRGSIYYHFRSKAQLRAQILQDFSGKALLAAQYMGAPAACLYPLQNAIGFYSLQHDEKLRTFIHSAYTQRLLDFGPVEDQFEIRSSCYRRFLSSAEIDALEHDPWTEASLQALDINRICMLCRSPDRFCLEDVIRHLVCVNGKMYAVPPRAINDAWDLVAAQMNKIDFYNLHIRW